MSIELEEVAEGSVSLRAMGTGVVAGVMVDEEAGLAGVVDDSVEVTSGVALMD